MTKLVAARVVISIDAPNRQSDSALQELDELFVRCSGRKQCFWVRLSLSDDLDL
jgi:hypothetical protein